MDPLPYWQYAWARACLKKHSRNLPQIVTHILQKAFFKHALAYTEIIDYKIYINCKYRFRVISGSHILHLPVKSVIVGIKVHYIFDISFKFFIVCSSSFLRDGEHALGLLKNQLRYTREEISPVWEAAFIPTCCVHTLRSRLMGIWDREYDF